MKQLDLQDDVYSVVYINVVRWLKSDATLKSTIHPDGWRTYTDEPDNSAPPGEDTLPAVEILPYGLGGQPGSLVTQEADFGIALNIATDGLDVRDLMNLWMAFHRALFKGGDFTLQGNIRASISALGNCHIASIGLTAPAISPTSQGIGKQMMLASGSINVKLRLPR